MSTYILGTGLSHDGSTCLLKDGKIITAIEKERLSRIKHDGGNDYLTVRYCLAAAGITVEDLALIVQASNFENNIHLDRYRGMRYFEKNISVPVLTISHHLAHAWSAAAASPFEQCNIMVIDGAGSPYTQCIDLQGAVIPDYPFKRGMFCEKDSFYRFDGRHMITLYKDFSEVRLFEDSWPLRLPTNYHSIGGLYSAASFYCFGNMDDAGKLMGLAPYGRLDGKPPLYNLSGARVEVLYDNLRSWFTQPSCAYEHFRNNFQHYADIARWVQDETEKAICYLFKSRQELHSCFQVAYAGGVALNAAANRRLLQSGLMKDLFMQPAAGDNGLAVGCAYYGWHEVLGNRKEQGTAAAYFGRHYADMEIKEAIRLAKESADERLEIVQTTDFIHRTAAWLAEGKIVGWFQGGAEFGPRALGHRSILADPRLPSIRNRINQRVKFREDFRPFAPAVRKEDVTKYFVNGWESPYMILLDQIKNEWKDLVPGIVHVDGTCRVQTVTKESNADFYNLISAFDAKTGIGVLLNTSLNCKGMPIAETPSEAMELFLSGDIDILILHDYTIRKLR